MAKTMKTTSVKNTDTTIRLQLNPFHGRMFTTSEIGRGVGVHKIDKGKGSYTRKPKHKGKTDWK